MIVGDVLYVRAILAEPQVVAKSSILLDVKPVGR